MINRIDCVPWQGSKSECSIIMAAIGILFTFIVTTKTFIICFVLTGFAKIKETNGNQYNHFFLKVVYIFEYYSMTSKRHAETCLFLLDLFIQYKTY